MTGELLQREQYAKGGVGRWYWDLRDERALSYIGPGKNILDVGCGEGITLEKMFRRFPDRNVLGIDYEEDKVTVCRKYLCRHATGVSIPWNWRTDPGIVACYWR